MEQAGGHRGPGPPLRHGGGHAQPCLWIVSVFPAVLAHKLSRLSLWQLAQVDSAGDSVSRFRNGACLMSHGSWSSNWRRRAFHSSKGRLP